MGKMKTAVLAAGCLLAGGIAGALISTSATAQQVPKAQVWLSAGGITDGGGALFISTDGRKLIWCSGRGIGVAPVCSPPTTLP